MASIFTGLAFMHGHIVDRELIFRLGRDELIADRGAGSPQATPPIRHEERKASREVSACPACASC
ncbi:hypothetical protein BJI69_09115 [Luteibacter rhizovicinus DSM 16549]|uniref:Uncharacterized protein n=1 Tax=Luteibacter rhizovicinus DSM 16549 TaxID=1440763 RepID=A0A0G9H9U0_9GAMM|nr:hypothetical protein [Luteibacter rhizovicinus]APG04037.1 hypothetical protein BJI69_09115 [Luteibacter rhizovicinus DSM 16549]KLD66580.1 hypothetical protein Y883_13120 [Luteibacter rhizovicinus DSM 16549]KLD73183.1 hypothetical protein Y886_39405 [Xanthomonas hyacinthi DSM 19077]